MNKLKLFFQTHKIKLSKESIKKYIRKEFFISTKDLFYSVALAIALGLLSTVSYSTLHAKNQLKAAKALASIGEYAQARDLLDTTQTPFVFGNVKLEAQKQIAANNTWLTYLSYQHAAEQLMFTKNYDQAKELFAKITSDYPGYDQIKKYLEEISLTLANGVIGNNSNIDPKVYGQYVVQQNGQIALKPSKTSRTQVPANSPPGALYAVCDADQSSGKKQVSSTAAFNAILDSESLDDVSSNLNSFTSQYGLSAYVTSLPTLNSAKATELSAYSIDDLCQAKINGAVIVDELSKYPKDFITTTGLKGIALAKNVSLTDGGGAVSDGSNIIISTDTVGDNIAGRTSFHHTLFHLLMKGGNRGTPPSDSNWESQNLTDLDFGKITTYCYTQSTFCASASEPHPVPGFVSGKAAVFVAEEDQAETFAWMMGYYSQVSSWAASDSNLAGKVSLMKQYLSSISSSMGDSYY